MKNVFSTLAGLKAALPHSKRITLVGGCFDLIHVGHIHLLEFASSLENLLVVAVLSDEYARGYKGVGRPIISQNQRVEMVASVRFVDFAYIADASPSSPETLRLLEPSSVVFEQDARGTEKAQARVRTIARMSPATKIRFFPRSLDEGISTDSIIRKIRAETP